MREFPIRTLFSCSMLLLRIVGGNQKSTRIPDTNLVQLFDVAGPSCLAGLGLGEHQGGLEGVQCHFLTDVNKENEKRKS